MKHLSTTSAMLVSLALAGCAAGPGGVNNAANRALTGAAAGAAIGGIAGTAIGSDAIGGAALGALLGGAAGAAVSPKVFHRDTRGYCYYVDAEGRRIYDYSRTC